MDLRFFCTLQGCSFVHCFIYSRAALEAPLICRSRDATLLLSAQDHIDNDNRTVTGI